MGPLGGNLLETKIKRSVVEGGWMTNALRRRNCLVKIKTNDTWFSKENEIQEGVARAFQVQGIGILV